MLKYNNIIADFVWNNKPTKIKHTTLIAPVAQGGLQLQDLQTKIDANKLTWIKNIINPEIKTPWKAYLQFSLPDPILEIPLYHIQHFDELNIIDKCYNDMFGVWSKLNYSEPNNIQEAIKHTRRPAPNCRSWKWSGAWCPTWAPRPISTNYCATTC